MPMEFKRHFSEFRKKISLRMSEKLEAIGFFYSLPDVIYGKNDGREGQK